MAEEPVREGLGKGPWVLILIATGAGAGALARYPLGTAASGVAFLALYALGLIILGLPLLLAEGALGQFRRRNVVDAFGPGPWRFAGATFAVAALLTAVVLAVVAAWFTGFIIGSFQGDFFDDPERHFRLISAGWDTLLATLAVIAVATGAAISGLRGKRTALVAAAVGVLIVIAGLAAWAFFQSGSGVGREQALAFDLDDIDAALVAQAFLQALLPTVVALGLVATLSSGVHDRTLPRDASLLTIALVAVPLLAGLFLLMLASANDHTLAASRDLGVLFFDIPRLFADVGGTEGGFLFGLFYGALLAASVVAIAALLEVPALWLRENWPMWTPGRAMLACGLVVYIIAVPFAFWPDGVHWLHLLLAGVVVPLGGLATAVHVGWVRPQVLDGFRVGEAGHKLDAALRPYLRFVAPPVLLILLVVGALVFLVDVGAVEHGSGGLWRLVP